MNINPSCRGVRSAIYSVILVLTVLSIQTYSQPSQDTRKAEPQSPASDPTTKPDEKTEKLKQLESQVALMQQQLDALRSAIADLKGDVPSAETAAPKTATAPTTAVKAEVVESKSVPAQTRPDLGVNLGTARLTPYGSIYFNAFSNTGGTNNADVPLFATSATRGNTGASLRQTRLGVRLEGAKVGEAKLNAILEADFFGGFPSIGIGENFGVVRLRLANVRLDWEKTSLTLGQDWSVFAPVSPTSLAAAAIPQMAAAGNNWARLPQIRVDHKAGKYFLLQGAVAAQQSGDSATNAPFFLQPNSGSMSRVPFFQGRIAMANISPFGTKKTAVIGLSGHYGRSRIFTGQANTRYEIDSFGAALDWSLPLHERLLITGEAFFGRNLAGFQGGVFQGYNTEFAYRNGNMLSASGVRGIGTRGGWAQVGFTPDALNDRLSLYASLGLDDPRNADLITFVPRDLRKRNLAYAFDVIYKFSPQFSIGTEFRRFQTDWTLTGRQRSNHINLGAVYSF